VRSEELTRRRSRDRTKRIHKTTMGNWQRRRRVEIE
jgi:hypothetical protein